MTKMIDIKPAAETAAYRYARGWHCLGEAAQYRNGALHTLNVFGSRLLAFANEQGEISVLDANCPTTTLSFTSLWSES